MKIAVKRAYEEPAKADGVRVLVDRLWPRGVSKESAALDDWLRELAPSDELRQWFHARPALWLSFRRKYLMELAQPEAEEELRKLYSLAHKKPRLTLVFSSKNETHNNAIVLKELLEGMRKPPNGTGPAGAYASRSRAAAMRRR